MIQISYSIQRVALFMAIFILRHYKYNQTNFILLDSPTGLILIDQLLVKGFDEDFPGNVPITSARFTKLAFKYSKFIDDQASQFLSQ